MTLDTLKTKLTEAEAQHQRVIGDANAYSGMVQTLKMLIAEEEKSMQSDAPAEANCPEKP